MRKAVWMLPVAPRICGGIMMMLLSAHRMLPLLLELRALPPGLGLGIKALTGVAVMVTLTLWGIQRTTLLVRKAIVLSRDYTIKAPRLLLIFGFYC
jgi:hypothetical protein